MKDKEYEAEKKRIKGLVDKWVDPLGLKWFEITINYNRDYQEKDNNAAIATYSSWMYRHFTIDFFTATTKESSDAELEDTIVHELVHCLTAPLASNMIGTDSNDQYRRDLIEQTVDMITKAFGWVYEAGVDDGKVKAKKENSK